MLNSQSAQPVSSSMSQVPIYSLTAWFGLYMKEWTVYWDCAREVYEAVCIYAFFRMLVCYLDGEQHIVDIVASKEQQPHLTPFNWIFKTWTMGPVFYLHVRFGVLQYVYLRSITAIITFMTNLPSVGVYHDGNWKLTGVYPYVTIVNNFSQIMVLLVSFFFAYFSLISQSVFFFFRQCTVWYCFSWLPRPI
jgi:hypothetical protein